MLQRPNRATYLFSAVFMRNIEYRGSKRGQFTWPNFTTPTHEADLLPKLPKPRTPPLHRRWPWAGCILVFVYVADGEV